VIHKNDNQSDFRFKHRKIKSNSDCATGQDLVYNYLISGFNSLGARWSFNKFAPREYVPHKDCVAGLGLFQHSKNNQNFYSIEKNFIRFGALAPSTA
jgi:hypothetical protein